MTLSTKLAVKVAAVRLFDFQTMNRTLGNIDQKNFNFTIPLITYPRVPPLRVWPKTISHLTESNILTALERRPWSSYGPVLGHWVKLLSILGITLFCILF